MFLQTIIIHEINLQQPPSHLHIQFVVLANSGGVLIGVFCLFGFWLVGFVWLVLVGWFRGSVFYFQFQCFFSFGKQITLPKTPCQEQDPACRYHSATHTAWVHPPPGQWLLHKLAQLEGDTIDRARTQTEKKTASHSQGSKEKKIKTKSQNTPYYSLFPTNQFSTAASFNLIVLQFLLNFRLHVNKECSNILPNTGA